MIIVEDITTISSNLDRWKKENHAIGLVPTMGFFHEGHLSLIRESKRLTDKTVVSIFVNPRQFGPNEDLEKYPRNIERDTELAQNVGADMLFCPPTDVIYPPGYQTNITVAKLSKGLCGSSRPDHFDGVGTVITKLFNIVEPDVAVFGRKDYQQLALIKQLTRDLNFKINIVGHETVREGDGMAMSSRNKYLSAAERKDALCIYKALCHAAEKIAKNKKIPSSLLKNELRNILASAESCEVDYIDIVEANTLDEKEVAESGDILAIAAYFNKKVRLIDNISL